ncbi:hypothetical protein G7Z17_g2427 [Cylindrodendrum hubeiense]|uniref:Carboxypeptidase M14B n=1 Tax=Cylindrodendrum hubeiense TaxID=595255 RepID=A0A9P5LL05_9HYPO|nr:hypothetical protein G7Z17_g2427 [Cylindrodendrum hubeiense]
MHVQHSLVMSLLLAGKALASGYANNQESALQDGSEVAALFPEPDIDLLSPAFLSPETIPTGFANNSAPPTTTANIVSFLKSLAKRNSWINYQEPDFRSEEGRLLPYVYLSKDRNDYSEDLSGLKRSQKLRIWLQGGVHGDEPAGSQALLALVGKFNANKTWASSVLDKADILVLPAYNPDGIDYFQRPFATGFDGNRDHALLQRQQTRDIKSLLVDFDPHVALDAHEFTAGIRFGGQYIKSHDVQFSAVKNPNIRSEIRQLGEDLFTSSVFSAVRAAGFRTGPYFTGSGSTTITLTEPGSISQAGHNSWGLGQRLTFLSETRGIRLGDQHFKRRVAAGLLTAETLIQVAVDNKNYVYKTIESARKTFIAADNDIIVVDKARVVDTTMEFIDITNGTLVDVAVKYNNNTPPNTIISRRRPEAYIFSGAWGNIAEHLRVLGVQVDVLKKDFSGTVDTLIVSNVTLATSRHEGIVQATVRTEPSTREVLIPAGGFRVSTRQQNAAFAFVSLEPENIASLATYNKIPLNAGDEYPIFRVY